MSILSDKILEEMLVESGGLVEVTCKQKYNKPLGTEYCNYHQCPLQIIYTFSIDGRKTCDLSGKFKVTWTEYIKHKGLFK